MRYNKFGQTDIDVSAIALGTMTWGEQNHQDEAFAQMDFALEQGINFFDTAEMYPVPPKAQTFGATETMIGNWLNTRKSRDQVFLATKVTGRGDANPGTAHIRGGPRLSAEQIHNAINDSLKRLQTDYVDLYQLHWPERSTNFFGQLSYQHKEDDCISLQETLSALNELVIAGKVRHIGLSNDTPWGLMECKRLAMAHGLPLVQSIQNPYSLLNRSFEIGLAEIAIREKIGLLAYSPMAFGTLSGKYLNGNLPEGARLTLFRRFARYSNPQAENAIAAYAQLAQKIGVSPAQLALAFVASRPFVTCCIIGATTMAQLKENLASNQIQLTDDTLKRIEEIEAQARIPSP